MTVAAKSFQVIDRTHLKTVMKEHELSFLGITDPKKIKKLGEVAGVDAIITSSVTPFGDSIRVTCKVIATDTARTIGASKGDIAKTKAIDELLAKGIDDTVAAKETASSPVVKKEAKTGVKAETQQTVEADNFQFELQKCVYSGQTITCYFMVTNKGKDRNLSFGRSPRRIFDDAGNEYQASQCQLGNKSESCSVGNDLVSGIPMKANINFQGVSGQMNKLSLLEMGINDSKVQFRNIQLSK